MIFDGKPTSEITSEELQALVENRVEEDAFLDFKAQPYQRNDHGNREMLKDVAAFANAQGGYLIIGIREEDEQPRRANAFVNVENPEGVRQRMIDCCLEKIEPRFSELDIRCIPVAGDNILVCRIPESDQKPHCAWPNREHHSFWRRYEDGNRLMSVSEIRTCLEGNRVLRELAEFRRGFAVLQQQLTVVRESELELNEGNVFDVTTEEAFNSFVDNRFEDETGGRAYYRLTATPVPINRICLRDKAREVGDLLVRPPELRAGGWDLAIQPGESPRTTSLGVLRRDIGYKHIRVLWNGHVEFWTEVDDLFFQFSGTIGEQVENRFLFPYAVSEPVVNFLLLVQQLAALASYDGDIKFRLGLYGVHGFFLGPGHPTSFAYRRARMNAGRDAGPQPYPRDNLLVPPVSARASELPGQVAWRLVYRVYQEFGYPRPEEVPFFDDQHGFILGD